MAGQGGREGEGVLFVLVGQFKNLSKWQFSVSANNILAKTHTQTRTYRSALPHRTSNICSAHDLWYHMMRTYNISTFQVEYSTTANTTYWRYCSLFLVIFDSDTSFRPVCQGRLIQRSFQDEEEVSFRSYIHLVLQCATSMTARSGVFHCMSVHGGGYLILNYILTLQPSGDKRSCASRFFDR